MGKHYNQHYNFLLLYQDGDVLQEAASGCRTEHKYWAFSFSCCDQKAGLWKMLAIMQKMYGGNRPELC